MFKNRTSDIDNLKKEIDSYQPLSQNIISQLKEYYRIGLTYSSNALEGNSLSEAETKVILKDGLTIGGKTVREHLEVIGHSQAYDFMYQKAQDSSFGQDDILKLHCLFYYRIDQENAGAYRNVGIIVTGTDFEFPKPWQVPTLMNQFCQEFSELKQLHHPVHFAALLHVKLVTIHPFIDGNGRTARLLMNLALLQQGYPITIIPTIMRPHYLAALRQSNQGQMQPFLDFISEMVYESSKEYLRLIKSCL